jgi:hypothetical protein
MRPPCIHTTLVLSIYGIVRNKTVLLGTKGNTGRLEENRGFATSGASAPI